MQQLNSTMTEVADMLLREYDVPFRIGHHFASEFDVAFAALVSGA